VAKATVQGATVPAAETVMEHNCVAVRVSVKTTVPLGSVEPAKLGTMAAVKLTCWLTTAEGGCAVTVTVVVGALTV
jgi:hypothetical protein